jgi:hypothetical protein
VGTMARRGSISRGLELSASRTRVHRHVSQATSGATRCGGVRSASALGCIGAAGPDGGAMTAAAATMKPKVELTVSSSASHVFGCLCLIVV